MATIAYNAFGRACRVVGQTLDNAGAALSGGLSYVEKAIPSTRVVPVRGKELVYENAAFIASTGAVIGDVTFGSSASAWYGTVIRANGAPVKIGFNSAVLDNASVTSSKDHPTTIGNNTIIQPGATVTGATIGNNVLIGFGATIGAGSVVGDNSFIDSGAVLPAGTKVGAGELWIGSPAKCLRKLSADEIDYILTNAHTNAGLASIHRTQSEFSVQQLDEQLEQYFVRLEHSLPSTTDPYSPAEDIIEYYKLTAPHKGFALFREHNIDMEAEGKKRYAEEVEGDRIESEYFNMKARLERVGEYINKLSETRVDRPENANFALDELIARDPEGFVLLKEFVVSIASIPETDALQKQKAIEFIRATDTTTYLSMDAALAAAEAAYKALIGHAPTIAAKRLP